MLYLLIPLHNRPTAVVSLGAGAAPERLQSARTSWSSDLCVTLIACGERWQTPAEDGALRVALEDDLGAGAILSYLRHDKSPEARVCAGAFLYSRDDLLAALWECGSGRELRSRGFPEDVRHAAQLNVYEAVPVLRGARLERLYATTRLCDTTSPGTVRARMSCRGLPCTASKSTAFQGAICHAVIYHGLLLKTSVKSVLSAC